MRKWKFPMVFIALLLLGENVLSQNVIIRGATLYPFPGAKPVSNSLVVVQNGKIIFAGKTTRFTEPKNSVVIDGRGLYLTAGFWNCHVHFTEPKWNGADTVTAERLTKQLDDIANSRGFTEMFDVGELDFENLKALRSRIENGGIPGPSIHAVGVPLVPVNGSPFYIRPAKLPEIGDAATAPQQVMAQVKAGAEGIKLFVASSNGKEVVPMDLESAAVAVKTAHRYGLPVFAHPSTDTGVRIAIAAGVDVLAHVAPDGHRNWDLLTVQSLVKKNIAVIPTLKMFRWSLVSNGGDSTTDALIPTALQQLTIFSKTGGVVLFGTDVGYMTDYETSGEFGLMAEAGLDFSEILRSLTTAPARKFGLGASKGQIAAGFDGDLVLLSADPFLDPRNFARVAYTIRKGRINYQAKP